MTILDRCATPLRLNRWRAEGLGESITTVHSDVLDFDADEAFDLIVTHSFLGYFDAAERTTLVKRWFRMLSSGGRVLTVHRIRPGATQVVRFTPDQSRDFERAVVERAVGTEPFSPAEIRDLARRYAANFEIYPVASEAGLADLLEGVGFRVALTALGRVEPRISQRPAGPSAVGDGFYVSIEAARP